jgi:ATP-dependent Clp protease ATP-binding subunit ClpA
MFNRLAAPTRQAVKAAAAEAARRGDRRLGTDHLVLGILQDGTTAAAQALGVDLTTARSAIDAMDRSALAAVGVDAADAEMHEPPGGGERLFFTSAAKDAMRRTFAEAVRTRSRELQPEHLLLALLAAEPPDSAADLLTALGIDPAAVRQRLNAAA